MAILPQPRALADLTEIDPELPRGNEERFSGYGVMGLPFATGHVLALRRFPSSSLGYGYSSVWHRSPDGRWSFWSDVPAEASCPRFFGEAVAEVDIHPIAISWLDARSMRIRVGGDLLDWRITLRPTPATVAMNAVAGMMTDGLWKRPSVLRTMARVAGVALGVGDVRLAGTAPNGQRFLANPLRVWMVAEASAILRGVALGQPAPLARQAYLGEFAIPQRGVFTIGRAFFEPFDPARHSAVLVQQAPSRVA